MRSAASFVNDSAQFTAGIEDAVKAYAASKPWQGDRDTQDAKLKVLHDALCQLAEIECGLERVDIEIDGAPMAYVESANAIKFAGRISVVTYLYTVAGPICGFRDSLRMSFAVNLYKRAFPRSFRRADLTGPTVKAGK